MRLQANSKLLSDIRQIHLEHRQVYGEMKTWRALNEAGLTCGNIEYLLCAAKRAMSPDAKPGSE